jgi:hypothetical protein
VNIHEPPKSITSLEVHPMVSELNAMDFRKASKALANPSYSVLNMEFCMSDFGWNPTKVELFY